MSRTQRIWLLTLLQVTLLACTTLGLMMLLQPNLSTATNPATLLSSAAIQPLTAAAVLATILSLISARRTHRSSTAHSAAHLATLFTTGLAAGLSVTIPWENAQVLTSGHWGMSNLYEVSVITIAILGILAMGFDKSHAHGRFLPFITPIIAAASLFTLWLTQIGASTPSELAPALQNSILPFHVIANFIGYGCFAIGAAAGAAILWRNYMDNKGKNTNLPPVATLEKLAYQAIVIGFPVFSLAILLGCVWAYQAWGGYWSWDPKETWALIVWLIYAAYLHARPQIRTKSNVLAWWLLLGFLATLFCYIGVNMFLSGLHSYGSLAA